MRLFGLPGNGPYMTSERKLANPRETLLTAARYQIVPSPRGVPMAQIGLTFRRDIPTIHNPDMTLAVVLDRSGSMSEAFKEGHVYNVAAAIFNHVFAANIGFDLVFYDDTVSYAGPMQNLDDIRTAIKNNGPRGGTQVTEAIRGAIKRYQKRKGMYLIVITDGEFADKDKVQKLVVRELLPKVTPDNPYAFRLHFVGAGHGVDHAFLQQIEAEAAGQGVPLVTQHHHAHLSHSHASILDEIDKAFLGVGTDARFGDPSLLGGKIESLTSEPVITHTTEPVTRRTWDGAIGTPVFLPRRVLLGCEYAGIHPVTLDIAVQYQAPDGQTQQIAVPVPLPKQANMDPAKVQAPSRRLGFHLPWGHVSPEEEAARTDAERQRAEVAQKTVDVRKAEQIRQAHDMTALAAGGLPQLATERLKEIGNAGGEEGILSTSNLSPEEAALLRREGYKVRGLVSGSAMYHVGQSFASTQGDCEVTVLSDAYNTATELAVSRMQQELRLIGAHGVIGVRLTMARHEWAEKTVEVQVLGTAIVGPGAPPAEPWMCDLSGQEWWALHRAGYQPAALVWGHCTWFILTTSVDEMAERSWNNQELTHWSTALTAARNRALKYATDRARKHHATGIAGVKFERHLNEVHLYRTTGSSTSSTDPVFEREHHDLVVSIIGTGIRLRPDAPAGVHPTQYVLSLRDGRLAPVAMGVADVTLE